MTYLSVRLQCGRKILRDSKTEPKKMLAFFTRVLDWIKRLFWKEEMELTLVGLQYSGKTTFVNVIAVSFCSVNKAKELSVSKCPVIV